MRSVGRARFLLIAITIVTLVPFVKEAFRVDDPLFIWIAQQITKHPFDPYGFNVNWVSFAQPMSIVMQNPPFSSYYIAAVASIFGWSEPALHLAFLFWAVMSILGTFALARRFSPEPSIAALLTLFTPVFLVSATSTMCDVMMLAFWVWAIEFWLAGLDRQQWWRFLFAGALISAAALTKYFGVTLVLLLAVYTVVRDWRLAKWLVFLLIPIAVLFNYDFLTEEKYGRGLFSAAMLASSSISSATRPSHFAQMLMGLAFGGGSLVSAFFFAAFRSKRFLAAAVIAAVVFAGAFKFGITSWVYLETAEAPVWLEGGLFAAIGLGILALSVTDVFKQRNADALLLVLWVIGTFLFATFFNWSVTARTFLPMAPAAAILVSRNLEQFQRTSELKYVSLCTAAGLSMLIAAADYRQANCAREAAMFYQKRYTAEADNVRFLGHWGFQYYMQQWGAKAFDRSDPGITDGNVLVGPFGDPNVNQVSMGKVATRDESTFKTLPLISTSSLGTGASFYSSFGGPLPWVINQIPPERYFSVRAQ